ncbi:hypothetical protein P167DRAFT_587300 [Morchella conica CCBAS932]|uniref:Uncharacterized protein n=1 Tax=Morchella conica CCBAS932 TaxID=1392247 RepID=A0A3N4KUJ8_9PEZI|nr:hypothetical protein P167DRAFT_587300 [Morchella conica CCBAS932]
MLSTNFFLTLATFISFLTLRTNARTIYPREVPSNNNGGNLPTTTYELRPIRIDPLMHGLNRRSEVPPLQDFSRLVPSDQELMMYGIPLDDGTFFVANLTLSAPENSRILLMEKFEGLTSNVDCSTIGDHKLSVTLVDEEVFSYIQIWSWINEREDNQFVMITNHEGCGPAAQRAVFWVRKVDYVEEALRVDFYAVQTDWAEVAGTYSMDFGTMQLEYGNEENDENRVYGPLEKRFDLFGKIKNAFDDAGKAIKKTVTNVGKDIKKTAENVGKGVTNIVDKAKNTFNKVKDKVAVKAVEKGVGKIGTGKIGKDNLSLNIAVGKANVAKNIYTGNQGAQIVDCLNCYVTGKILMSGNMQFVQFVPKSAIFEVRPRDIGTTMKFRVFLQKNDATNPAFQFEKDVYSMNLPAINIPGVFGLGPKAELTVSFQSNVRTDADFSFGVTGSVPNNALFRKDLLNKNTPGQSGKWKGVKITPLPFELNGGAIDMKFDTGTNLVFGVGVFAIGVGSYDAGFRLRLPRIGIDLKTVTNKNGKPACAGNANKSPTGVTMKSDANIELVAVAGKDTMTVGSFSEKMLWGIKFPLPSKCFPIKDSRGKTAPAFAQTKTKSTLSKGVGLLKQVNSLKNTFSNKNKKGKAAPKKTAQPAKKKTARPAARKTAQPVANKKTAANF